MEFEYGVNWRALIGFRGRGFDDGLQPDFGHHLLLESLIFQGP